MNEKKLYYENEITNYLNIIEALKEEHIINVQNLNNFLENKYIDEI